MPTSGRVNNLVIRWDKTVWTTDVWNLIKSPSLFHFLNKFTVGGKETPQIPAGIALLIWKCNFGKNFY